MIVTLRIYTEGGEEMPKAKKKPKGKGPKKGMNPIVSGKTKKK